MRPPRSSLGLFALACLLPVVPAGAAIDAQRLSVYAGSQVELLVDKGVDRVALADESVATLTITSREKGKPAARLLITGKAPGGTTLMVWEKGSNVARTYQLDVARRTGLIEGSFASVPAQRAAADAVMASLPKDAPVVDKSVVLVRSHTVQVEVRIIEFSRNVLKEIGLNLSSFGPNSSGFSFASTSPAGTITDAFAIALGFGRANKGRGMTATLNLLESNGFARVLAEPTLVTMSGQSASFLAGGELPIPVAQSLGTTTLQFKPFGIGLTVTPTVLSDERIALKVAPEASDLDYNNAISIGNGLAVPAIITRRADTTIELGDGESFIIGGLVSRSTVSNVGKVPLLGDLPILGAFFKQQSYTMNEKELVIMVTPRLVKPIARGTDLSAQLPGGAEQRDGPVWRTMMIGNGVAPTTVPGFSR